MEFEIEESFKEKIDCIIEKDFRELFGENDEEPSSKRHSLLSLSKPEVKTILPIGLHEILIGMEKLVVDNPYNRLLTAIEQYE